MATDYVDAGVAVDNSALSHLTGSAPPVVKGVTYDRILNARSEPHNWLTYYGAYDGQRYSRSTRSTRRTSSGSLRSGSSRGSSACTRASRRTRSRPPPSSSTGSCSSRARTGLGLALDPGTEDLLWQYRHAIPFDVSSLLRQREPRGRRGPGHGLRRHAELAHHRARRRDREEGLGPDLRRRARRRERDGRPAHREGHGDRRQPGGEFGNRGHSDASSSRRASASGGRTWCRSRGAGSETWPDDGEAWQRRRATAGSTNLMHPNPTSTSSDVRDRESGARLRWGVPRGTDLRTLRFGRGDRR